MNTFSSTTEMNYDQSINTIPIAEAFEHFKPFVIPAFQRGYVWKLKSCQTLAYDLFTVSARNLKHLAARNLTTASTANLLSNQSSNLNSNHALSKQLNNEQRLPDENGANDQHLTLSKRLSSDFDQVCAEIFTGDQHGLGFIVLYPEEQSQSKSDVESSQSSLSPQASQESQENDFENTNGKRTGNIHQTNNVPQTNNSPQANNVLQAHNVLDGQQRITTLMLLARAIHRCLPDTSDYESPVYKVKQRLEQILFTTSPFAPEDAEKNSAGTKASAQASDALHTHQPSLTTHATTERSTESMEYILKTGNFAETLFAENKEEPYAQNYLLFLELCKSKRTSWAKNTPKLDRNINLEEDFHHNLLWADIDQLGQALQDQQVERIEHLRALFPTSKGIKSTIDTVSPGSTQVPFIVFVALNLLYALEVIVMRLEDDETALVQFDRLNTRGQPISKLDLVKARILSGVSNKELKQHFVKTWQQLIQDLHDLAPQLSLLKGHKVKPITLFTSALLSALAKHPDAVVGVKSLEHYCDKDFTEELVEQILEDLEVCYQLLTAVAPTREQQGEAKPTQTAAVPSSSDSFIFSRCSLEEQTKIKNYLQVLLSKDSVEVYLPVFSYFIHLNQLLHTDPTHAASTPALGTHLVEFLRVLHARMFLGQLNTGSYLDSSYLLVHNALQRVKSLTKLGQVQTELRLTLETANKELKSFDRVTSNLADLSLDLELILQDVVPEANFAQVVAQSKGLTSCWLKKPNKQSRYDKRLSNSLIVPKNFEPDYSAQLSHDKTTDVKSSPIDKTTADKTSVDKTPTNKNSSDKPAQLLLKPKQVSKHKLALAKLYADFFKEQDFVRSAWGEHLRSKVELQIKKILQLEPKPVATSTEHATSITETPSLSYLNSEHLKRKQAKKYSMSDFFALAGQAGGLFIPDFQRGYQWSWRTHVVPFFSDLVSCTLKNLSRCSEFQLKHSQFEQSQLELEQFDPNLLHAVVSNEYSMGFSVYVTSAEKLAIPHSDALKKEKAQANVQANAPEPDLPQKVLALVDGQQRLTTVILLARALYGAIKKQSEQGMVQGSLAKYVCNKLETIFSIKKEQPAEETAGRTELDKTSKLTNCAISMLNLSSSTLPQTAQSLHQILLEGHTELDSKYRDIFMQFSSLLRYPTQAPSSTDKSTPSKSLLSQTNNLLWQPVSAIYQQIRPGLSQAVTDLYDLSSVFDQLELNQDHLQQPNQDQNLHTQDHQVRSQPESSGADNQQPFVLYLALNLLHALKIVSFECASYRDAVQMFDRLNNGGTPLDTTDIIKARLYYSLAKDSQALSCDDFNKRWNKLRANIEEALPEYESADDLLAGNQLGDEERAADPNQNSGGLVEQDGSAQQDNLADGEVDEQVDEHEYEQLLQAARQNKRAIPFTSVLEPLSYYHSFSEFGDRERLETGYEPLGLKYFFSHNKFTSGQISAFLEQAEFNAALILFAFKPTTKIKNKHLKLLLETKAQTSEFVVQQAQANELVVKLQNLLVTLFSFNHTNVRVPILIYFWKLVQDHQSHLKTSPKMAEDLLAQAITFLRKHLSNLLLNYCYSGQMSVGRYLPVYTVINILAPGASSCEDGLSSCFDQCAFASMTYMNSETHPSLVLSDDEVEFDSPADQQLHDLQLDKELKLEQVISRGQFAQLTGHRTFLALALEVVERFNSSAEGSAEGFSYNNFNSAKTSKCKHGFAGYIDCYKTDIEHIGGRYGDALASEQEKFTWLEHAEKIANKVILESSTNRSFGNATLQGKLEGYSKSQFVGPQKIAKLYSNGTVTHSRRFLAPELEKRSQYLFEQLDAFVQSSNELYYAKKPLMPNYPTERSKLQEWFKQLKDGI